MTRTPAELRRVIENGLDYDADDIDSPQARLVLAALAELQALAEAGRTLAQEVERIAAFINAAPSPADREEAS